MCFYDTLRELDPSLHTFVKDRIHEVIPELKKTTVFFDEYTDHSESHSERILSLGSMLNKGNELNQFEIAIFILSCYYHDLG